MNRANTGARLDLAHEPHLTGFFFFWRKLMACGILVPWPGIEPTSPAVEAQLTDLHWLKPGTRSSSLLLPLFHPMLSAKASLTNSLSRMYLEYPIITQVPANTISHLRPRNTLLTAIPAYILAPPNSLLKLRPHFVNSIMSLFLCWKPFNGFPPRFGKIQSLFHGLQHLGIQPHLDLLPPSVTAGFHQFLSTQTLPLDLWTC